MKIGDKVVINDERIDSECVENENVKYEIKNLIIGEIISGDGFYFKVKFPGNKIIDFTKDELEYPSNKKPGGNFKPGLIYE